jgi:predicted O-methyltransferase YrrM
MAILPVRKSSDVFGNISHIKIIEPVATDGNINDYQMQCLVSVVQKRNPKKMFEFGTFDGRTTLNLANFSGDDAVVFTLDLPQEKLGSTAHAVEGNNKQYVIGKDAKRRFQGYPCKSKIVQLWDDSATFASEGFYTANGPMDMVFVDGCHSKEYTLNDSRKAKSLVRGAEKPIIVWHDYGGCWEEVTEALDYLYEKEDGFEGLFFVKDVQLVVLL